MSAPTAAEIAIVLDIIVRNTLIPRSRWFSITASASPRPMPMGTVYRAKIPVARSPVRNVADVRSSV